MPRKVLEILRIRDILSTKIDEINIVNFIIDISNEMEEKELLDEANLKWKTEMGGPRIDTDALIAQLEMEMLLLQN